MIKMDQSERPDIGTAADFSPGEIRRTPLSIETAVKKVEDIDAVMEKVTEQIDQAEFAFVDALNRAGVSREDDLRPMALREAIVNKVYHGNFDDHPETENKHKTVKTRIEERLNAGEEIPPKVDYLLQEFPDRIVVTVKDYGKFFDWRTKLANLPDSPQKTSAGELKSSGLGLTLIVEVFGEKNIQFDETGNQITITVPIKQEQASK